MDHAQISFLILSEFKQVNKILLPLIGFLIILGGTKVNPLEVKFGDNHFQFILLS